jgi:hypothetical protein
MRHFTLIAFLLAAPICSAQVPALNLGQPTIPVLPQAPADAQKETLVIPAGTRIPMTLTNPITTKSHRGDAVRAVTAFPVSIDNQLAIPVGTYVEGVIDKVNARVPSVQMHFTRMFFSNGYNVNLDANNSVTQRLMPHDGIPDFSAFDDEYAPKYELAAQQQMPPTLPPLHNPGPSVGLVTGLTVGVAAAVTVALILLNRHAGAAQTDIIFDTGWQFEMVLQNALSLDSASVAVAAATPSAP